MGFDLLRSFVEIFGIVRLYDIFFVCELDGNDFKFEFEKVVNNLVFGGGS